MTASSSRGEVILAGSRIQLLWRNLAATTGIFLLLEIWRPCFFLTDDNMTAGLPVWTEVGQRLWRGESPFVSDYLFGGNYHLLNDASFFNWHPFYLLSSLLAETPAHFLIMEVPAFLFLLLATAGFVNLAHYLRGELSLEISDGWITFYTLSYTFTFMALATGSSWLSFLGNHSALPWLTLGILQKSWRQGLPLVGLFSLHHLLGGHQHPLVTISLCLSVLAVAVAYWRRSLVPLVSWGLGNVLAVLIVLPLLLPALHGFFGSHRSAALDVTSVRVFRIPALVFPFSYFFGTAFWLIRHPPYLSDSRPVLAACAASWCLIPALFGRAKWQRFEIFFLVFMAALVLLMIRPVWLTEIMLRMPLLRSMRWPFRELLIFHFFLHLFLLVRPPGFSAATRRYIACWGVAIFAIPMWLYAPPSLNPMTRERNLLFSGGLETYWAQVKQKLGPNDRLAVIIPGDLYNDDFQRAPYGLLGSHNYCCLLRFVSASGYSPTAPSDSLYLHTTPAYYFGAFETWQMEALWNERPDLKLMVLEKIHPYKITLRSKDGTSIDLTPYIPPELETLNP